MGSENPNGRPIIKEYEDFVKEQIKLTDEVDNPDWHGWPILFLAMVIKNAKK